MDIYSVPDERRYWVVRAEGGKYYNHFKKNGVVALGHVNALAFPDTKERESFRPDEASLIDSFATLDPKNKRQAVSVHLAQVKSFIYEMNVGDWVITIGADSVSFGRIISAPYINKSPIEFVYDIATDNKTYMDFHLRRDVVWGPSVARSVLPYGLVRSMKANQTLFCLDKHLESIYHTLYPAFIYEKKLHLSARITTEDEIKNHSISGIFNLLNDIEIIGKELSKDKDINDFDAVLSQYINQNKLTITTKAQFHSPGDIWNTIAGFVDVDIDKWFFYVVLAYSMIFGNQKLGFDGVIDVKTRQKMWALVLQRKKDNKAENIVENLQLKLPKYDTSLLETDDKDKKHR